MLVLHPPARGSFTALLFSCLFLGACSTDAVAVDECREIESARCEASVHCGVLEQDEVQECKKLYEDQCLHGIAGPKAPTADQQNRCVRFIEQNGETARASLAKLGENLTESEEETVQAEYDAACSLIGRPWDANECAFVAPEPEGMGGAEQGDE